MLENARFAKSFRNLAILIIVGFAVSVFAAEPISIAGKVVDSLGGPIPGVIVKLNSTGQDDTTDALGKFGIGTGTVALIVNGSQMVQNSTAFSNGKLTISAASKQHVVVDIFNAKGVLLSSVINQDLPQGVHGIDIGADRFGAGMLLIRVLRNGDVQTFRYSSTGSSASGSGAAIATHAQAIPLARSAAAAVDTLICTRYAYSTVAYPVESMIDTGIVITMKALNAPFIAIDNIHTAIDTIASLNNDLIRWGMGDTVPINVVLRNIGANNALSVGCTLTTADPYVTITKSTGGYNNIAAGEIAYGFERYYITVPRNTPSGHGVKFIAHIADSWGGVWVDSMTYVVNPLVCDMQVVDDDNVPDSRGNNDHVADSGEIIEFTPRLLNADTVTITGVQGFLYCTGGLNTYDTIVRHGDRSWLYGNIGAGLKALPNFDYVIDLSKKKPVLDSIPFTVVACGIQHGVPRKWLVSARIPGVVRVTGVTVSPSSLGLVYNGDVGTLTATVAPANAKDKAFVWSSSDTLVAKVNNGVVTSVNAGTATISATTSDGGKVSTCDVIMAKAMPTITTWPTASGLVHGQTLSESILGGDVHATAGTFAFTSPITVPDFGTSNQSVTFTPTDAANYSTVIQDVSVTVNLGPATDTLTIIAGGTFYMGDASNAQVHSVTVSTFTMANTECTQREYLRVMGVNPSSFTGDLTLPVETVAWYDAVRYCIKRSVYESKPICYDTIAGNWTCDISKKGYRLPTEAEWEYAVRAGNNGDYYWPDENTLVNAWFSPNSGSTTHPVATKTKNAYGLYDMSGNVWEWCGDWYKTYSAAAATDPTGAATGSFRVNRGGSWENNESCLSFAYRNYSSDPDGSIGFRVVLRP